MVNLGTQILGKKDAQRILDIDVDLSQLYVGKTLTIQNFTTEQVQSITFYRSRNYIGVPSLNIPRSYIKLSTDSTSYTLTNEDLNCFIGISCTDKTGATITKTFYFSSVPVVYIDTKNGTTVGDMDVDCRMRVQGDSEFSEQYNGKAEIHVRGDSSAEYATQLPYKIKLKKKTSLFGFGSNKHWVLVSNFVDNSLMRNMLATQLADVLGVSRMKMKHVVVILNGVNIGVYLLAQHIRVNENIVNIFNWEDEAEDRGYENDDFSWVDADSSIDVSGGYLYELDEGYDETTQFTTNGGIRVMLRRPEYSRSSRRMVNSEMEFWRRFELAMKSSDFTYDGDSLDDFMDISSYAKLMMVNIVLQNIDISTRSLFASKDINGKVVFGPIWDFDLAADSVVYENELRPNVWGIFRNSPQCIGLNLLMSYEVRRELLSLYSSTKAWLQQTIANFDQLISEFSALGAMNDAARRTNIFNPSWKPSIFTLRGFQDDAAKLKLFLQNRLDALEIPFASMFRLTNALKQPYEEFVESEIDYPGLKFTAEQANSTVNLNNVAGEYRISRDGVNWNDYELNTTITLQNIGDIVYFSARTTNDTCYLNNTIPKFSMSGKIAAYGNIQSLLDKNCERMNAPSNCYRYMFSGCKSLTQAPELPATTLDGYCYANMFSGCTSLMAAPALPATTLADRCYYSMFYDCRSLTQAPELPASSLANECYIGMFQGCKSLTQAPELPATTLANSCYSNMFKDCSSLTSAPQILPATTLANSCYYNMFYDCTSLTQAPELPATTLADRCYYNMFYDCRSLTQAPELPASSLANECYINMFQGCRSLMAAPALPATTLANSCYSNMFKDCSSLTSAPQILPATTLANSCYSNMFQGCTSLMAAPALPATTLTDRCYSGMFWGCSSLTQAPELPATILNISCYYYMFNGCKSLTQAPELPATTLAGSCYSYMFYGCTTLTQAPELPATTLESYCYSSMFSGCTSLMAASELPATTLNYRCYYDMFYMCPKFTTVKMKTEMNGVYNTSTHGNIGKTVEYVL